ncbi:MAG TPA: M15 family metallopeptidase [Actinomycetota bacterium]|nr:M15 family metallopeptidase [Actinomycetota bacterium]
MKKPIVLIAPGMSLFTIGTLMLIALTGFRIPPGEPDSRVALSAGQAPALVMSPRDDFLPAVLTAARGLPDVTAVAEVRSGTRWLNAWSATGAPGPTGPAPGYQVPVDVASVDPEQFRNLVPQHLRARVLDLGNGGAILSRTGAALRGITQTGTLHFPGADIPVIGVVDDPIVRNHEIVMSHNTGLAVGLDETRYVVIGLRTLQAGKQVEDGLRAAIPPGASMRVRGPQGSGASSGPSPLLSLAQVKAAFGEYSAMTNAGTSIRIDQGWIDANTEMATLPLLGTTRCHKKVIPQIAGAVAEIEQKGLAHLIRHGDFGGCFSPRFIRSGKEAGLSRHSWGAALDFNVSSNLYGQPPTMDMRIVEIFERHGFSWGGRWNYPDGMHFEVNRPRG